MKIRTDFVTNSSSSSFILARKEALTEQQKKVIIEFVEAEMLGKKILTPDSTEEEILHVFDEYYISQENQNEIRKILKDGKSVYSDDVIFENCEYLYGDLFITLWEKLEAAGKEDFETIDGSLEY